MLIKRMRCIVLYTHVDMTNSRALLYVLKVFRRSVGQVFSRPNHLDIQRVNFDLWHVYLGEIEMRQPNGHLGLPKYAARHSNRLRGFQTCSSRATLNSNHAINLLRQHNAFSRILVILNSMIYGCAYYFTFRVEIKGIEATKICCLFEWQPEKFDVCAVEATFRSYFSNAFICVETLPSTSTNTNVLTLPYSANDWTSMSTPWILWM